MKASILKIEIVTHASERVSNMLVQFEDGHVEGHACTFYGEFDTYVAATTLHHHADWMRGFLLDRAMQQPNDAARPPASPVGTNSGHGHVWARPDGLKAKCGGRMICPQCAQDYVRWISPAWSEGGEA